MLIPVINYQIVECKVIVNVRFLNKHHQHHHFVVVPIDSHHHVRMSIVEVRSSISFPPTFSLSGNDAQHIRENTKTTEVTSSSKIDEETTPTISSAIDGYQFIGGSSQLLTFDPRQNKSTLLIKQTTPSSSIPQKPVSMHPTVRFSTKPIDIQFGDVQWNDSVPIAITPSNSPILAKSLDEQILE